ncbi:unnamed protein product [Soboliphyme baturini]|uniref:Uncharacterized protein n=1 Tax=Soboliphyme baturini TaxID=241478 RepID=A0A183J7X5_9BILA|nr:unnamed protein product [Soboliphyme baturini]
MVIDEHAKWKVTTVCWPPFHSIRFGVAVLLPDAAEVLITWSSVTLTIATSRSSVTMAVTTCVSGVAPGRTQLVTCYDAAVVE